MPIFAQYRRNHLENNLCKWNALISLNNEFTWSIFLFTIKRNSSTIRLALFCSYVHQYFCSWKLVTINVHHIMIHTSLLVSLVWSTLYCILSALFSPGAVTVAFKLLIFQFISFFFLKRLLLQITIISNHTIK